MSGFNIYLTEKEWDLINLGLDLVEADSYGETKAIDAPIIERIEEKARVAIKASEHRKEKLKLRRETRARIKRVTGRAQKIMEEVCDE